MAEVCAAKLGLQFAINLGCSRVVLNSNDSQVINTLCNEERSYSSCADIFKDWFHLMADFVKVSFEHCNREASKVAHEVARLANFSNPSSWADSPPP